VKPLHYSCYIEICLNWTLSKLKTCLNQTDFTVPSTKCLCNLNLCKPSTCLNWTNSSVPKGFGLDRFYCIASGHITNCVANIFYRLPNHEGFRNNCTKSQGYDSSVVELIHLSHCYNIDDIWIGDLWTIYTVVELLYQYFGTELWVKLKKIITIKKIISQSQGEVFACCHLCLQKDCNSITVTGFITCLYRYLEFD